ncbi:MAG: DUF4956 domain-containing protein [Saccharofermentanales bacterium]|jgi:hypothetical protein
MNQLIQLSGIAEDLISAPTLVEVLLSVLLAIVLAGIMFLTYRFIHRGMSYDSSFNIMLAMLSIITTILMILIRTNVALSLGMLGSLSLVRFRTNVKDNRDIGFVFWSMSIGLAAASHAYFLGLLISVILAAILIISNTKAVNASNMLLVIRGTQIDPEFLESDIKAYSSTFNLRAQNLLENSFEIVYEIKTNSVQQMRLSQIIKSYDGVDTVNILAPSAVVDV